MDYESENKNSKKKPADHYNHKNATVNSSKVKNSGILKSEVTKPGVHKPGVHKPGVIKPGVIKPGVIKHGLTKPTPKSPKAESTKLYKTAGNPSPSRNPPDSSIATAKPTSSNSTTAHTTVHTATKASSNNPAKFNPADYDLQIIRRSGILANRKTSPANHKIYFRGYAINVATGEQVLEQTDFRLPGPLPLVWSRTYRTSHIHDFGLGPGWSAPYFSRLHINDNNIVYADGQGRLIPFSRLSEGGACRNIMEHLTLYCDSDDQLRIVDCNATTLLFHGQGKTKRLSGMRTGDYTCDGYSIDFQYNDKGRLTFVNDSAGRTLKLDYNISNRLHAVNLLNDKGDPLGKPLAQYRYSTQGDLIAVVDAAGNAQHFEYRNHVINRHTTKDGFNYYYEWDAYDINAKCVRNWSDRNIYQYRFQYDQTNRVTSCSNGRDHSSVVYYNRLGLITREIDPEGGAREFEYDSDGRLLAERDPMGNTTRYGYGAHGKPNRIVDPLGHTTRLGYDDNGRLTWLVDATGQRWRRHYDTQGRLSSISDPLGRAIRLRYDNRGFPAVVTDPMRRNLRLEWNDKGELLAITDAAGNRREYRYDHLGRITEIHKYGKQVTQYSYDPMGRVTQVLNPDGSHVKLHYTPEGRLARYIDALGRSTQYRYDGLSHPVERTNAHGQTVRYEYDEERRLSCMTNENGDRCEMCYDKLGRLIKHIGFDGRVQHFGYNTAGHMVSHTDGANRITQFKRDALGQLIKKWSSDQDVSRYEYDPLGRLVHAVNNDAELAFKYSDNGQLIEEWQNGVRLRYEYDLNNLRSAIVLSKKERIDFEYNAQGLFKRIAYNGATLASITRNTQGQEIARTSGAVWGFFEYDAMRRLVRQRATKDQRAILERFYQYDKGGNLKQIDDINFGTAVFKYDALDRLQAVEGLVGERFSFDPAGNMLDAREAFAGHHAKGNRVKVYQDYRFEYDDVGNLIYEKKGGQETRYYYNTQHQLIKTEKNGAIFNYYYDPLGRRVKKTGAEGDTLFIWDDNNLLIEQHKNHKVTYVHESGSSTPLCQIRDGKIFYCYNDHLGTPLTVTAANGDIVWEARYKVYGNIAKWGHQHIDNNIRFQGQYFDSETGLYYNGCRYYHAVIGRFVHKDPIGFTVDTTRHENAVNSRLWPSPLKLAQQASAIATPHKNTFPAHPQLTAYPLLKAPHEVLPVAANIQGAQQYETWQQRQYECYCRDIFKHFGSADVQVVDQWFSFCSGYHS